MVTPAKKKIPIAIIDSDNQTFTGNKIALIRAEEEHKLLRQSLKTIGIPVKASFRMEGMTKNMQFLDIEFTGRPGSIYEGCVIKGTLLLGDDYPEKNPKFKFKEVNEKTFKHINVYGDGNTCLDVLTEAAYRPNMALGEIIAAIEKLIYEPNENSPANIGLKEKYNSDRAAYDEEIKSQSEFLKKKK